MHEKNSTNEVMAYNIVVFLTVYSAEISKFIITKPKK